jgi:hypothetical protein
MEPPDQHDRALVRAMVENGEWSDIEHRADGALTVSSQRSRDARIHCRKELLARRPDATAQELYELSTCLGEYNPQLASDQVRAVFSSPTFSPLARFVVAANAVSLEADDVDFIREDPKLRRLVKHYARKRLLHEACRLPGAALRVLGNLVTFRWARRA